MVDDDGGFMQYLRLGSDSLGFRTILKVHKRAQFSDIREFVFSAVKPLINRDFFFDDCQIIFSSNLLPFHVKKRP